MYLTLKVRRVVLSFKSEPQKSLNSDGGTTHTFHLYNLTRETEWQCQIHDVQDSWSKHKLSPYKNVWAAKQILPKSSKLLNAKQSTRFICIIYPGKHIGTVLFIKLFML